MTRRLLALLLAFSSFVHADPSVPISFIHALAILHEGNDRFAGDTSAHPDQTSARRLALVASQAPFATVLACADSRVGPEIIFDQGLGSLFTIRVAGNVASTEDIASIEYSTEHLNVPLVIVMGHSGCGAVKAAVAGSRLEGNLPALIAEIAPAIERVRREHPSLSGPALVEAAIEANVWLQIENLLARSEPLRRAVAAGRVHVVGAVYQLETGRVRWLGPHPMQGKLVASDLAVSMDWGAKKARSSGPFGGGKTA